MTGDRLVEHKAAGTPNEMVAANSLLEASGFVRMSAPAPIGLAANSEVNDMSSLLGSLIIGDAAKSANMAAAAIANEISSAMITTGGETLKNGADSGAPPVAPSDRVQPSVHHPVIQG